MSDKKFERGDIMPHESIGEVVYGFDYGYRDYVGINIYHNGKLIIMNGFNGLFKQLQNEQENAATDANIFIGNLTLEQRLTIYLILQYELEEYPYYPVGYCRILELLCGFSFHFGLNGWIEKALPELHAYKPNPNNFYEYYYYKDTGFWFKPDDRLLRIKILEQCIEQLSNQLYGTGMV